MSNKEKRKSKRDYDIYYDSSDKYVKRLRPNLYKMPAEREKLDRHLYYLSLESRKYLKEIRIKGLDERISEEIALTRWL